LEALAAQSYPRDEFEVIVVDDGGVEPLDQRLAPFRHRLDLHAIRQTNQGPAAARNVGAAAARAPFFAFTDDDCCPDPDWLRRLVVRLEGNPHCLYGGRVVNAREGDLYAVASQLILDLAYAHHNPDPNTARFFTANNLAVPADGFWKVGGFDSAFRVASEDRDFCARWRELGLSLVYAPEAVAYHAHHLTPARFCKQHFAYGRGAWRYHQALRRRRRGHLARDLSFHLGFMARAIAPLAHRPPGAALRVATLLIVWQVANAAGFLVEGLLSVVDRAKR
jgi:GT2 family glycosyltransferase